MITPIHFVNGMEAEKNITPIISVNKGVRAFKIPAIALSIRVSAIQNKNAGKKVPRKPVSTISGKLESGILLNAENAKGNRTMAPEDILTAATWYALSCCSPAFISINELPQMMQIKTNSVQFT